MRVLLLLCSALTFGALLGRAGKYLMKKMRCCSAAGGEVGENTVRPFIICLSFSVGHIWAARLCLLRTEWYMNTLDGAIKLGFNGWTVGCLIESDPMYKLYYCIQESEKHCVNSHGKVSFAPFGLN